MLVIVVGIVMFLFALEPSPVTAFYFLRAQSSKADSAHAASGAGADADSSINRGGYGAVVVPSPAPAGKSAIAYQQLHDDSTSAIADTEAEVAMWQTVRNMSISVFFVFWVTLSLFPGITSKIDSTHATLNPHSDSNPNGTGWFGIIMVFVFCLGDLVGRWVPKFQSLVLFGPRGVLVSCVLRLVFFALFLVLVKHQLVGDAYSYATMFVFALTNGYFSTLSLMFASEAVPAQHKEYVGVVTVFALTLGLTAGVWTGVAIKDLF